MNRLFTACACALILAILGCEAGGSSASRTNRPADRAVSAQRYIEILHRHPPDRTRRDAFHAALEADLKSQRAGLDEDAFLRAQGRSFGLAYVDDIRARVLSGEITSAQARDALENGLVGTEPPFPFMQGAIGPLSEGLQWLETHEASLRNR